MPSFLFFVRACLRPCEAACLCACSESVSLFHTEDNRRQKRMGGSFVPLDERRHWLYVNFAARNESLRQVCVWKGFEGRVEIESTNTTCILLHMYQGSHVQACTGIFCIISYGGLILSAGLIGHSQLGAASRRVAFCHGSHFQGPNFQAVHSIMLSLGSTCHAVARTLSTHPGMVLTLERRRADAAG